MTPTWSACWAVFGFTLVLFTGGDWFALIVAAALYADFWQTLMREARS